MGGGVDLGESDRSFRSCWPVRFTRWSCFFLGGEIHRDYEVREGITCLGVAAWTRRERNGNEVLELISLRKNDPGGLGSDRHVLHLRKSRSTGSLAFLRSHSFDQRRPPAVLTPPAKANQALKNQSPFFEIS